MKDARGLELVVSARVRCTPPPWEGKEVAGYAAFVWDINEEEGIVRLEDLRNGGLRDARPEWVTVQQGRLGTKAAVTREQERRQAQAAGEALSRRGFKRVRKEAK